MKLELQLDKKDCGLVVLQGFYHNYYKKQVDINLLKQKVNYGNNGLSLEELSNLGLKMGLRLEILEGDYESFLNLKIIIPIFTLINDNNYFHYIVIEDKDDKFIYINDPAKEKKQILIEEFKEKYLNVIVKVIKTNKIDDVFISYQNKINFYKGNVLTYILISFLTILVEGLIFSSSFYIKYIVDELIVLNTSSMLIHYTILFGWIFLLKIIANGFNLLLQQKLFLNFQNKIMKLFFFKTLNAKIRHLDKLSKSDYMQRFYSINEVANFYSNILTIVFSDSIKVTGSLLIMFILNWKLAIIGIVFLLFNFIFSAFIRTKIIKQYPQLLQNNVTIINKSLEIFFNVINTKDPYFRKNAFKDISNLLTNNKQDIFQMWTFTNIRNLVSNFLITILQILVVYIGTYNILNKQMLLGNLILFNSLLSLLISPLNQLLEVFAGLKINKQNITRLNYILFIEEEVNLNKSFKIGKISSITFNNFSFSYGTKQIFHNINMNISASTQLKGKNGIGKSTLLKLIYGLYDNFEGNILINGIDINKIKIENLREHIFFNNNAYFANEYLIDLITLKDSKATNLLKINIEKYNLNDLLKNFNLSWDLRIEDGGIFLSHGQKQLISLLKLYCFNYDLILLDEAFENIHNDNLVKLKKDISEIQNNALFVEVSHSNKYMKNENILCI